MLRPFAHAVACCLLRVVGGCCAKFEIHQTFSSNNVGSRRIRLHVAFDYDQFLS